MSRRKTTEEFIEEANRVHNGKYTYEHTVYKNSSSKVTVTCPIHGDFEVPAGHHIRSKSGCRKCNGNYQMNTTEFIQRAKEIHGNKYDYSKSEYVNKNTKVCIICPKHGEFWQKAEDHYSGHGCRKCYEEWFIANQTFPVEVFLEKAKERFGDKYVYDLSKYETLNSTITITCPEHGTYEQVANTHLETEGCPRCGRLKANKTKSLTQEEFIYKCKDVHGDKYDYSKVEYVKGRDKITIICPEHGEFITTASGHLYMGYGCPKCILKSQTKLLEKLEKVFPEETFKWEYRNEWLGKQRIDICLEKYCIGIEYDGKQHYVPIDYFGGEVAFREQVESDALKNQKCKENGFTLFRLKYDYSDDDFYGLCVQIQEIINSKNNE